METRLGRSEGLSCRQLTTISAPQGEKNWTDGRKKKFTYSLCRITDFFQRESCKVLAYSAQTSDN